MAEEIKRDEVTIIQDHLDTHSINENSSLLEMITCILTAPIKYSDILLHEDSMIMLRLSRGWVELSMLNTQRRSKIEDFFTTMDQGWVKKLIPDETDETANPKQKKLNLSRDMTNARIRCNGFMHGDRKLGMTIRRIPKVIPKLAEIGLPFLLTEIVQRNRGLILITGPVGNGKSTTMAALLNYVSNLRAGHIVTLEDPLEFVHTNAKSIFTQREIPKHANTFKDGFEEALRERPDVIAIGELRNRDTVETCLEGSDAGLLMLGTMHSNNASSAISKFLNFYPDSQVKQKAAQLADSLLCIISQTLVPSTTGHGAEMAYEILVNSPQVSKQIQEMSIDKIRDLMNVDPTPTGKLKSNSLNASLIELIKAKKITKTDAMNYCYDPDDLKNLTSRNNL